MPKPELLECFDNPQPSRPYLIEHISSEFTSLCPKTGHPDFASIVLRFVPNRLCVELKSLKLYYQSYRNDGIFYEAVTNRLADDLQNAMKPTWMKITTQWSGRGGIRSEISVEIGQKPQNIS